jgi:hypothetical protein
MASTDAMSEVVRQAFEPRAVGMPWQKQKLHDLRNSLVAALIRNLASLLPLDTALLSSLLGKPSSITFRFGCCKCIFSGACWYQIRCLTPSAKLAMCL